MPQMAPMSWITIMMMTMFMIMQLNSMIFFNQNNLKKKNINKKMKLLTWKW